MMSTWFFDFLTEVTRRLEKVYDRRSERTHSSYAFALYGLVVHSILLWGVLDVNFHSPIVEGLPSVPAPKNPPAKRLVLFVADGLRFRTFAESPPKYLRQVMTKEGTWGVSHTRMPTESRPGVVAICAGLYEDPSALFKGWKENPVDFDSIFNQSRFTWAWGSPDIVPIFTKGARENIKGDSYPHEWEDFDMMQGQIWRLDSWVFDKYTDWLREEADKVKDTDGIVLFLHLLGCDTTGHTAKPNSREYADNMNYVDRKVEELVRMTEEFFGNGTTAYVFTADHGMTNWGSHGSGSTDETETPLVAWGAGVNVLSSRQDVEQVDITPLMSTLIGIPIPVNNEGILPWKFLHPTHYDYGSRALLNNAKQLALQVKGNRGVNCADNSSFVDWRELELETKISMAEWNFRMGRTKDGMRESEEALKLAKESLTYFRQYQRLRFLIYLSTMWLGWIVILCLKISGVPRSVVKSSTLALVDLGFVTLLLVILLRHYVSDCENWRLPFYASLAVVSLWLAVRTAVSYSLKLLIRSRRKSWMEVSGVMFLLATMFVGLTYRSALSVGMLCAAAIQNTLIRGTNRLFLLAALCLAVFPLLPVVEPHPRVYVVLLGISTAALICLVVRPKQWKVEMLRLIVTAVVYVGFIDGRSWVSWLILITTPFCICIYPNKTKERMQGVALGLFCPYALLSASYEPFFFVTLALHLLSWPQSNATQNREKGLLTTEELLTAAYFMLYTLVCFFGTGNMASISSFDPSWTRHFVTVFSPFLMFSLILLKISIPLILVGCTSHTLGSSTVFLAVLLLGDCLSLPLMYCVTPQGSWLDIGSAISRFTIAITLPCLLLLLYYLSYPLMTLMPRKKHVV